MSPGFRSNGGWRKMPTALGRPLQSELRQFHLRSAPLSLNLACGRLQASALELVERDGEDDHRADDDLLRERGDAEQVRAVREHAHDERADDRSHDAPLPTAQGAAADDDGRDHTQLVTLARGWLPRHQPRRLDGPGEPCERAEEDVEHDLIARDAHARVARRLDVTADGVAVASSSE